MTSISDSCLSFLLLRESWLHSYHNNMFVTAWQTRQYKQKYVAKDLMFFDKSVPEMEPTKKMTQ